MTHQYFIVAAMAVALPLCGAVSVTLTPSPASPQPVGTTIRWTATGTDPIPGSIQFRFEVRPAGGDFRVIRDYHGNSVLDWAFYEREMSLEFRVTARNKATGQSNSVIISYTLTRRATGSTPVLTPTSHRLVYLYSTPPCPVGSYMRAKIRAGQVAAPPTPWKPCAAGVTMNFLLAGMRASTAYFAYYELATGTAIVPGPSIPFTTLPLPDSVTFPVSKLVTPPDASSCLLESVILHGNLSAGPTQTNYPIATDIFGRIIWYYIAPNPAEQVGTFVYRPLAGGTMLLAPNDASDPQKPNQFLREMDLAGNTVRETNVERINQQLTAMGKGVITSFHHEAQRLPSGNIITLAYTERLMSDVQGPGTVDILGDMIIELDRNLQVVWVWDAFDHMDVTRKAILNETCISGQGGCPNFIVKAAIANDWLHSNSVAYTPDGNLILSVRHQDWIVKIKYMNGTGDGRLLWRLGKDGDFTIQSSDPYPWFSHQHDAEYDNPGQPSLMSLYDNGNVRRGLFPAANSRGQVLYVNEPQRTVTPVLNADLGVYAFALGSAERLCNGNFFFDSGIITGTNTARSSEVLPNGRITYTLDTPNAAYRTFRMFSLFQP